jgi:hypothetical protein
MSVCLRQVGPSLIIHERIDNRGVRPSGHGLLRRL